MTIWFNILKRKLKDYKVLFMMSIFPIMLTVLFVNMFTAVDKVEEKIHFTVALREQEGELTQGVKFFIEGMVGTEGINLDLVSEKEADFIIEVDETKKKLTILNQSGGMVEETTLSSLLNEFTIGYTMNQVVGEGTASNPPIEYEYIQGQGEKDIKTPLVITMLIFGILLGGNFGIGQVFYMKQAVGIRAFTTSISKRALFLMEYTTSSVIIFIISLISMGAYGIIFKIDFSQVLIQSMGLVLIASLLTTLLGMTIGLYVRDQDMGENILSVIITLSAMLSGKLMPMFDLGNITILSPIKPLVEGLESLVQSGHLSNGLMLIGYFIVIFLVLGGLVMIKLKREGDLQ